MALPTSIETLLGGQVVEWARIEFKETWDPQASLKTICAFANDIDNWGGGYLVLGVREADGRREPIGVPSERVDPWLKDFWLCGSGHRHAAGAAGQSQAAPVQAAGGAGAH